MNVNTRRRVEDRVWRECERPIRGNLFSCRADNPVYRKCVQLDDNVWIAASRIMYVLCNEQLLNL